jgi:hypothetical protein
MKNKQPMDKLEEMEIITETLPGGLVRQSSQPTGREYTQEEIDQHMKDAGWIERDKVIAVKEALKGMGTERGDKVNGNPDFMMGIDSAIENLEHLLKES